MHHDDTPLDLETIRRERRFVGVLVAHADEIMNAHQHMVPGDAVLCLVAPDFSFVGAARLPDDAARGFHQYVYGYTITIAPVSFEERSDDSIRSWLDSRLQELDGMIAMITQAPQRA